METKEYITQLSYEFNERSWEDMRKNRPLLYQKLMAEKQKKLEAA